MTESIKSDWDHYCIEKKGTTLKQNFICISCGYTDPCHIIRSLNGNKPINCKESEKRTIYELSLKEEAVVA